MQKNSLVVLVGSQSKQDPIKLDRGSIYTVYSTCYGKFSDGWDKAIYLEEIGDVLAFRANLFREIDAPKTISIDELLQVGSHE